jgi:hypothetical protein
MNPRTFGLLDLWTLCLVILAAAVAAPAAQTSRSTVSSQQAATYRMDVASIAGPAGSAGLRLAVRTSSDGSLVRNFKVVHEEPFHLFVVGRDLRFFRHLHPALLPDGSLEAREEIPPGEYLVAAEFQPSGGPAQFLKRVIDLRGDSRGPRNVERSTPGSPGNAYDVVTNVRIQPLPAKLQAGQRAAFHVMLSRTEDGRPIVNLEPVLGGGGHLLAVSEDLAEVVHAHASADGLPVSLLTFDMTLPKPRVYVVWVEFRRFGETLTARLGVRAR